MSVRHAACYLDVSESTVRRWIVNGRLRSRIVARGGRFYHEVLVERGLRAPSTGRSPTDIVQYLQSRLAAAEEERAQREEDMNRQEEQIQRLSAALARALQQKDGSRNSSESPYEKYRWLARRGCRRLWPFQ